jgi:hypothetical protein
VRTLVTIPEAILKATLVKTILLVLEIEGFSGLMMLMRMQLVPGAMDFSVFVNFVGNGREPNGQKQVWETIGTLPYHEA